MGKLRKIGKKIWNGVKKVGKKIGKGFKKVFAGVGKFLGKLGPIGTIAMMIAMPYIGAYLWQGFGTWAAGLKGTFGTVMKGVYKVGNSVMGVYKNITDAVYGTLKQIPGVGDALEGFDRFLDRTRSAMGLESGSISVLNDKELNSWVGTDAGAKAMGYENAAAFKTANPTYFTAEGTLSKSGLNFARGKSMAYEAHLRGRDVFNKVDGEFDFNSYSDNFKTNVLDTDFVQGDISRFGESLQGKTSITFRTGSPQGVRQSTLREDLAAHKKTLSAEELKVFNQDEWIKQYKIDNPYQKVFFEQDEGLFGQRKLDPNDPMYEAKLGEFGNVGTLTFEGVGSRYTSDVPIVAKDGSVIGYDTVEGTKFGRAFKTGLKQGTLTSIGGSPEQEVQSMGYSAQVAEPPQLETASTMPVVSFTAGSNTTQGLNYLNLLSGNATPSGGQLSQFYNSGVVMPHLLPPIPFGSSAT